MAVIPAKAGIRSVHFLVLKWIPAFAGMKEGTLLGSLDRRVRDAVGRILDLDPAERLPGLKVQHQHRVVVPHGDEGMPVVGMRKHPRRLRLGDLRESQADRLHDGLRRYVSHDKRRSLGVGDEANRPSGVN